MPKVTWSSGRVVGFIFTLAGFLSVEGGVLKKEDLILSNVPEEGTHLTADDFREAERVLEVDLKEAGVDTSIDPLLKSNKFEGDIAGGLNSKNIHQYINDSNSYGRNAIRESWRRWPNAQIPYVLSSRYGSYSRRIIAKAMDEYHRKTCIRFVPRDENVHRDYVYIFPDDGCYSLVGRTGGRQPLSLDSGCIQTGTVQHELMHATGFFHEQSRPDREKYIDIVWENVATDATDQFEEYSLRTVTLLDLDYDYGSVMHYGPFAFTKNGQRTIRAKKSGADRMGQRDGFSDMDLLKLNKLYDCPKPQADAVGTGGPGETSLETTLSATTTTKATPTIASDEKCGNKKWQCFFWQRLNYCQTYAEYMKETCPKSCNLCNDDKPASDAPTMTDQNSGKSCADFDTRCPDWIAKGDCNSGLDANLIRRICPRSCGVCSI